VLHGFRLDDDGDLRVIDHPDAATTIGPNLPITGTNLSGINNHREIVGIYEDENPTGRKGRAPVVSAGALLRPVRATDPPPG
jgi:hypothetical protein